MPGFRSERFARRVGAGDPPGRALAERAHGPPLRRAADSAAQRRGETGQAAAALNRSRRRGRAGPNRQGAATPKSSHGTRCSVASERLHLGFLPYRRRVPAPLAALSEPQDEKKTCCWRAFNRGRLWDSGSGQSVSGKMRGQVVERRGNWNRGGVVAGMGSCLALVASPCSGEKLCIGKRYPAAPCG